MSLVGDVITALKAITPAPFAIVEGAVELAAVKAGRPVALPAAYVFVRREAAGPSERATGPVLQRIERDLAVMLIAENLADLHGGALGEDLEVLKRAVKSTVVGFVPAASPDGSPCEFVGSEIVRLGNGVVWNELIFSAATYEGESS